MLLQKKTIINNQVIKQYMSGTLNTFKHFKMFNRAHLSLKSS